MGNRMSVGFKRREGGSRRDNIEVRLGGGMADGAKELAGA